MQKFRKIEFRQTRDTGQIFNAAFQYIRQNRLLLFRGITFIAVPFILTGTILIMTSLANLVEMIANSGNGSNSGWAIAFSILILIPGFILLFIGSIFYITVVYEHMYLYHNSGNPESITLADLWKSCKKRFWTNLANVIVFTILSSVLTGVLYIIFYILMLIGVLVSAALSSPIVLVVFVGIAYIIYWTALLYINAATFPLFFLSTIDRSDMFTALSRSFSMVTRKGKFIGAVGVAFLNNSVSYILFYIITVPLGLIIGVIAYNTLDASDLKPGSLLYEIVFKGIFPILMMVYVYTFAAYLVTYAFKAMDLEESVYAKGMMERVAKIGTFKDAGPEYYDEMY